MTTADTTNPFPLTRNLLWLCAAQAAGVALVSSAVVLLGVSDQLPAVMMSALACGFGAALAMIPMGIMSKRRDESAVNGAMLGMMIRLAVSLGGAAALGWATQIGMKPVLAWSILWYLILLAVEITMISRFLMLGQSDHATGRAA